MPYGQWSADYNVPFGPMRFGQPGRSSILNLTTVVNPTLTNEFIFGHSRNRLTIVPVDDAFSRTKLGLQFRMPFPTASPIDLVPNFQFGGVPNAPTSGFNGTPFANVNNTFEVTENLSKVYSAHTLKLGAYVHRSRKDQTAFTPANGTINFGRDTANPNDTNWAFSNALLGYFQTFQQSNIVRNGRYRSTNTEWYIQDNWKVRPGLTLDYGMRFYLVQPQYDAHLQTSSFNPQFFTAQDQVQLFQRASNPAGAVASYNPVTKEYGPAALIGLLVPGVGSFANGMARAGVNGYPRGLIDSRGVHYAPRVGVAWNPGFLKGAVVRAGGGIFFDRFQGNPVFDMLPNPPSTLVPTIYYGNIRTAADTPGVLAPANVRGFSKDGHVPTTYNWNVSVQKEIFFKTLLDVAYVGSVSRHLLNILNYNLPAFGSAWLPQFQDPTTTARFDGTTTLPVNFTRPYIGFGNANVTQFGATSNYNALQLSATRRYTNGLQYGLAYTLSKALGTASGDGDGFHPLNARMGMYGPLSFDSRHVLVFNFIWDLPKPSKHVAALNNPVTRFILDGWGLSNITTIRSGFPNGIGYGVSGVGGAELNRRITGNEAWGPRVVIVGDPYISRGQRTEFQQLNTSVFRPAEKGSVGLDSAIRGYLEQPGDHNWDVTVYKDFPYSKTEGRFIQLRLEMFNAWNMVRYSGYNGGVTFRGLNDPTVTNLPTALGGGGGRFGFGAINGARDPRIIQIATKIYF